MLHIDVVYVWYGVLFATFSHVTPLVVNVTREKQARLPAATMRSVGSVPE